MSLPNLPVEFTERMRGILGEEYPAFEKSYEEVRKYGLRVNTKKISPEEFERIAPFHLTPIPWIPGGYYYLEEDAPARHPFYHAGLYYLQEPSAMTPASILEIQPGDRVLDLCAAPGGKATALGAKLKGEGLLVANDISASRAKALLKNIEVFGIPNSFVTNAAPVRLAEKFPGFFDKILVDAPCSGEGMFRKDVDTIKAWYPEKPEECAKIQREIVIRAADMLRPGGMMLYSTCTFAPVENEEMIRYLMEQRPEMELQEIPHREGFSNGLGDMDKCVRLWPHKMGGEGHFLALLRKRGGQILESVNFASDTGVRILEKDTLWDADFAERISDSEATDGTRDKKGRKSGKKDKFGKAERSGKKGREGKSGRNIVGSNRAAKGDIIQRQALEEFLKEITWNWKTENLEIRNGQAYYVSGLLPETAGIAFLRNGLYLGEVKKDRFEPSQSLAMALAEKEYLSTINLSWEDERVKHYLRGETIEIGSKECQQQKGWQLVCVNGYPLGWGKLVNGLLKNKYHAGWRMK